MYHLLHIVVAAEVFVGVIMHFIIFSSCFATVSAMILASLG